MNIQEQLLSYHELTKSNYKTSTLEGHQVFINNVVNATAELKVDSIEDIDLNVGYQIRNWLRDNTRSKNNTINRHINYIKQVQIHYEIYTSLHKIINLKNDTKPFKRFYHEELKLIIQYVNQMNYSLNSIVYRTYVLLALDSGVRQSEALNIKISNIDFENMRIYLETTKTGKVRYAPVSNFCLASVKELIAVDPKRIYLFHNRLKNRQLSKNDILLFFRRLKERLGIERIHTHRFRKTFGSMLAENGMAIEHLQKIYNHSRITTTMKYVQYRESKSLEEYSKYVDWKV